MRQEEEGKVFSQRIVLCEKKGCFMNMKENFVFGEVVVEVSTTGGHIFIVAYRNVRHCGGIGRRYFGSANGIQRDNLFGTTDIVAKKEGNSVIITPVAPNIDGAVRYSSVEIRVGYDELWFIPTFNVEGVFIEVLPHKEEFSEEAIVLFRLPLPIGEVIVKKKNLPKGNFSSKVKFVGLVLPTGKCIIHIPYFQRNHRKYGKAYVYDVNGCFRSFCEAG